MEDEEKRYREQIKENQETIVIFQVELKPNLEMHDQCVRNLVLFRAVRDGILEWTIMATVDGKVQYDGVFTFTSASIALRQYADRCRTLCNRFESDYYENTFLPILDEMLESQMTRKLD